MATTIISAAKSGNYETVPVGSDLNRYLTPGQYVVGSQSDASKIANTPIDLAGLLTVDKVSNSYIAQRFEAGTNSYRSYTRRHNGTGWSSWIQEFNQINNSVASLQVRSGSININSKAAATVTFTSPFPTSCIGVIPITSAASFGGNSTISVSSVTTSGCKLYNWNDANAAMIVGYIALGY